MADGHNVTVDNAVGAGVYVRPGTSAVFTVDLATNNDVTIDGSSIVHLEDVAHSTGDAGIMALGVENEDQADLSTGDKDYTPIAVTKEGNVIVKQEGTITVTESSPLSGFATSAKQLADGHNVTVDNAAGAAAVNIQDGGNTITVDGAVTTSGTVALTNDSLIGAGDPTIDSYAHVAINLNAGANQVLVSSAASKQIWVYGITYTCSVAGTVSFQDEDDTAITGIMDHAANSGLSHPTSGNFAMPIWKLGTDKDLEVDVVTAAIDGWLDYAIVSV
ncbi:hypothetical protein KKC06_06860 [Patescibacteria group bacterium]|nr:hypothetical protein [Patescibacteria group bacterium]